MAKEFKIANRWVGENHPPLVLAEIGINHEGSYEKAIQMVDDAYKAGCECVKFQSHVIEDEMIPNNVIPGSARVQFNFRFSTASTVETLQTQVHGILDKHDLKYDLEWRLDGRPIPGSTFPPAPR